MKTHGTQIAGVSWVPNKHLPVLRPEVAAGSTLRCKKVKVFFAACSWMGRDSGRTWMVWTGLDKMLFPYLPWDDWIHPPPKKYSNWSWFLMLIPKVGSWFATDFFGERLVERIRNWKGYTGSMGINNCHCSLWLQFAWFNFAELFEKCHWMFFFSSFCQDGLWKKYILCAFSSLKRINDPRASDWRTTQHVYGTGHWIQLSDLAIDQNPMTPAAHQKSW
jgi:hypothetical protein